jgi:TonB family protein
MLGPWIRKRKAHPGRANRTRPDGLLGKIMRARRLVLTMAAMAAMALVAPAAMAKHRSHAHAAHHAVISNPDWVRTPKGEELFRLYPEAAAAQHVTGRTKAICHVLADGALDACVVTEECPRGYGFGRATLSAAQDFQIRPKTVNGVPVAGGTVEVPMLWTLDASAPPPACGPSSR